MTERTAVPQEPGQAGHRLEIGVDVPCKRCKMRGYYYEYSKKQNCARCGGTGFLTSRDAAADEAEEGNGT
jgi:DnaJ-class molecular chaperone